MKKPSAIRAPGPSRPSCSRATPSCRPRRPSPRRSLGERDRQRLAPHRRGPRHGRVRRPHGRALRRGPGGRTAAPIRSCAALREATGEFKRDPRLDMDADDPAAWFRAIRSWRPTPAADLRRGGLGSPARRCRSSTIGAMIWRRRPAGSDRCGSLASFLGEPLRPNWDLARLRRAPAGRGRRRHGQPRPSTCACGLTNSASGRSRSR